MRKIAIVAVVVVTGLLMRGAFGVAEEAKPLDLASAPAGDGPSLMGMLSQWAYPEATWIGGPRMSDGGNPDLQSVKCEVVLVTPDSFEDVVKYYAEKLAIGKKDAGVVKKDASAKNAGRTVAVIDDCVFDENDARPVKVQVITVNERDSSTTLVISRANEERETHIVWSHFVQFDGEK